MELDRHRLLRRLEEAKPKLVLLVAPAGFGKTTLARRFAERHGAHATCDCAGVETEGDFLRRVIAALSAESPARAGLAELQFALGSAHNRDADVEIVLQAWSQATDASAVLIVEAAEALAHRQDIRALFGRLLAATPARRVVVVCSRSPVRIPKSRYVHPHETATLGAADLAFDRAEIEATFAGLDLADATIDQIQTITRGWPIAILLLRRFANEGRLGELLTRLDDVAFDDIHDYLADEVFGSMTERERDVLIACASIPEATEDDVALALGDDDVADLLHALVRASPLVRLNDMGTYEANPLLQRAIASRHRRRMRELLERAAQAWELRGKPVRAARIYQRLGDRDATARAMCAESGSTERISSPESTAIVTSLDEETLRRYPVLLGMSTFYRRFRIDPYRLRDETKAVWDTLGESAGAELRYNVGCALARVSYEVGRFDEAETLLRELAAGFDAGGRAATSGQAYVLRTLACVAVRRGRLGEAERLLEHGYLGVPGARMVMSRYLIERAVMERVRGRRDEERALSEQAVEAARDSPVALLRACSLAEAAFGAWVAGDDERCATYVRALDECVATDAMRGFVHFCESARPNATAVPNGCEQPNWLACAYLMACGHARDAEDRARAARAAVGAADDSNDPFLQTLSNVALALASPAERDVVLGQAARHAAQIESPALHDAVAALVTGSRDLGMLAPLGERLRATSADGGSEALGVEFLSRSVRRGTEPVRLGERELALVLALARQRRAFGRTELTEMLWPGLDEAGAREALNSCLYRLRGRLRDDVVVWTGHGYRLRDDVAVDLRAIEAFVDASSAERPLHQSERSVLERVREQMLDRATTRDAAWDWLGPVETRIDDLARTIGERLGRDALRRGDIEAAKRLAAEMVAADACDEAAREIAIRALLARGDRAAALREYRSYRRVLQNELDVEPSAELTALLRAPAEGPVLAGSGAGGR